MKYSGIVSSPPSTQPQNNCKGSGTNLVLGRNFTEKFYKQIPRRDFALHTLVLKSGKWFNGGNKMESGTSLSNSWIIYTYTLDASSLVLNTLSDVNIN